MALTIVTESVSNITDWRAVYPNGIYPAFVDNLPYWSWKTPDENGFTEGFQLVATGATGLTWTKISGNFPDGLSMDANGFISGTPTKEGSYTFVVQVSATGQTPVQKSITMVADPWRGKRLRDARTVITTHWGKMSGGHPSYPNGIKNTLDDTKLNGVDTHIPEFESAATNFNAATQRAQFQTWGITARESSFKWQNHSPLWNSNAPTRYLDHSNRNFAIEETDEFKANNILMMTYFAPDSYYYGTPPQKLCDGDYPYGNWANINHFHIDELMWNVKVDGIIFDIGFTYEFPGVNPGYIGRKKAIGIIRGRNPWAVFGANPGTRLDGKRLGGALIAYPDCDFVIFETVKSTSTSENLLELGTPPMCEKKMAVLIWNQISSSWGFGPNSLTDPLKNTPGIISNMRKNVNVGATVSQALPVTLTTVPFVDPYFASTFNAIAAEHNASKAFSDDVKISHDGSTVTMSTPAKAQIFYTTDGTEPTTKSKVYLEPIAITKNMRVRARSLQYNKSLGYMSALDVSPLPVPENMRSLLYSLMPNTVPANESAGNYKGMLFTVLGAPIILKGIGRGVVVAPTTDHPWIIRRRWDEYGIGTGKMLTTDPVRNGFQMARGNDLRLEAGQSYFVAFKEGTVDKYAQNDFSVKPTYSDIDILSHFTLNPTGDYYIFTPQTVGQFINLEYEVIESERSKNLALGAIGSFTGFNNDNPLDINGSVYFPSNAFNGDTVSFAAFGGVNQGKVNGDMREAKTFSRARVTFQEAIPPSFEILVSQNGLNADMTVIASIAGNSNQVVDMKFAPTTARFVTIRNTSGTMLVSLLEVFKD